MTTLEIIKNLPNLKMNKILITGGLGHIGSGILDRVNPDKVEEIILVDNLLTQRYCSLWTSSAKQPHYKFYQRDICTDDLTPLMEGVDTVIHLAAITDAQSSIDDPERTKEVNLDGTKRVVDAAIKAGVECFVFPSTTSVYGPQEERQTEESTNLNPQTPYAKYKLEGEEVVLSSAFKNPVVFRLGTIYGWSPGMRFHTCVNKFVWQAINGIPITIWESAQYSVRPYLNLHSAIYTLLIANQYKLNGLYNVLTGNYTPNDIVEAIKKFIPKTKIKMVPSRILNQDSYEVSMDKLNKDLTAGFEHQASLEDYIKQMKNELCIVQNHQ